MGTYVILAVTSIHGQKKDVGRYSKMTKNFSWTEDELDKNGKLIVLYRHERSISRIKPNSRFLDMGGWGKFASRMVQEGHDSTLIDKCGDLFHLEWERYNNVKYVKADFFDYPFESEIFDCINCSETLEHVEDQEGLMKIVFDLLVPGGFFFGTVPIPGFCHKEGEEGVKFIEAHTLFGMLEQVGFNKIEIELTPSIHPDNEPSHIYFWCEKK